MARSSFDFIPSAETFTENDCTGSPHVTTVHLGTVTKALKKATCEVGGSWNNPFNLVSHSRNNTEKCSLWKLLIVSFRLTQ